MAMRPRAICPECKRPRMVRQDGRFAAHRPCGDGLVAPQFAERATSTPKQTEWDKVKASLAEAQAEVRRLKTRAVDHAQTLAAFTKIADIVDQWQEDGSDPFDAMQAIAEQVGEP